MPIAALVDRVLDESGFEAALPAEFLGDRKRANARKLVRLARRFDARGGFTLAHFVAKLREDLRRPPREDEAATSDEAGKTIRLMTIHQAKGLEFPIVVLPDLNRKQDTGRESVAFHPDLGPLVRLRDTGAGSDSDDATMDSDGALGWRAFRTLERAADDAEAIRIFYVAATRARDALILSAGANSEAKPQSAAMRLLDQRFDRATGRCRVPLPADWGIPSVRVTTALLASAPPIRRNAVVADLNGIARTIINSELDELSNQPAVRGEIHRRRNSDARLETLSPPGGRHEESNLRRPVTNRILR